MDPFIGQIIMFAGNFAPRGWAFCDGQLLAISSNTALFSILGTTYGGDGRTTFALPDLRGRVAIHPGNGPGLSAYRLGQRGGTETVTLNTNQIPSHSHGLDNAKIVTGAAGKGSVRESTAENNYITNINDGFSTTPGSGHLAGTPNGPSGNTGGNQAHNNIQPFGTCNYIIALQGTYPSRS